VNNIADFHSDQSWPGIQLCKRKMG